jgi:hypothetical protein
MSAANRARFTIELDVGVEPLRGALFGPDGLGHSFRGWLELSSQLEAARAGRTLDEWPAAGADPILDQTPPP